MTTYELQTGHTLLHKGQQYHPGDVLPDWYLGKRLDGLLAAGAVQPTTKLCNAVLVDLPAKTTPDANPAVEAELVRVTRENVEFARSNQELEARRADLAGQVKLLETTLGEVTVENARLKAALETAQAAAAAHAEKFRGLDETAAKRIADLEAENAKITADLEALTAPAAA